MGKHIKIWDKVYQIGGSGLTDPSDCMFFLVDAGNGSSVMIDCGAGKSFDRIVANLESVISKPEGLKALILTHCHIDHIGSAYKLKKRFGCQIIAHEKDANAIEGRDTVPTAADWYGVKYVPVNIDRIISGQKEKIKIGDVEFNVIHTPGHTPGSISVYCDISGKRLLFGQDIHGPFDASFGSNIDHWRESMKKLLELEADILCEGHFGIFQPKRKVRGYIEDYLKRY